MVSHLVRRPSGPVAQALAHHGSDDILTSRIVAAELRFGAAKRGSPELSAQLDLILSTLEVADVEAPFDRVYGDLRARLERAGIGLSAVDLLIAAHALTLDCVLVTDDQAFDRVPDLVVENWLRV